MDAAVITWAPSVSAACAEHSIGVTFPSVLATLLLSVPRYSLGRKGKVSLPDCALVNWSTDNIENTMLENIHVRQKFKNGASRRILREKTADKRTRTNPTCPPAICKARKTVCVVRRAANWRLNYTIAGDQYLEHTCAITAELLVNCLSFRGKFELKVNFNVFAVTLSNLHCKMGLRIAVTNVWSNIPSKRTWTLAASTGVLVWHRRHSPWAWRNGTLQPQCRAVQFVCNSWKLVQVALH